MINIKILNLDYEYFHNMTYSRMMFAQVSSQPIELNRIFIALLLENGAIEKEFKAGEIVYQENSPSLFYYHMLTGRIRLSNFYDDGKEVLHKLVCAKEGFGSASILDNCPNHVTAIADGPCSVLKIGKLSFMTLLTENQQMLLYITQQQARDLRFKTFLTKLICCRIPKEVITKLMQFLHDDRRLICQKCNRLMLTRQQLANMTGLRVETVIRTMKQLEKEEELNIIKGKVFMPCAGTK